MARKRKQEEEVTEEVVEEEVVEEAAPAGAEFVPERTHKPKSDVYTLVLILTFLAFLGGSIIAGREAWEHYDVQFWMFTKKPPQASSDMPADVPVSDPAAAPVTPPSNP